jgi:hypothetical protein
MHQTNPIITVTGIDVEWHQGFHNMPTFAVTIDKRPEFSELVYEKRGFHYFALCGDVAFFYFFEKPGEGFGGWTFDVKLTDGTVQTLKGPWSSNGAAMARQGFPMTEHVTALIPNGNGMSRLGYHVLTSAIQEKWAELGPKDVDLHLIAGDLIPHPKEGCISDRKSFKPHQAPFRCPVCDPAERERLQSAHDKRAELTQVSDEQAAFITWEPRGVESNVIGSKVAGISITGSEDL